MNEAFDRLARQLALDAPAQERLRFAFAHACALRVQHLLEDPEVAACLAGLGAFVQGTLPRAELDALAARAAALANRHPGSKSIDGCGHAAVSASYAVAQALAGRARQSAEYAAYAMVYGQGGYGAVGDPASFAPEWAWQAERLAQLAQGVQRAEAHLDAARV